MQDSSDSGQTAQMTKDRMFLRAAAEGGIAEVQFGQLAAQKGSSEEVKTFGQKMVDDHTALNKDMGTVADSIGIKLPTHMNKTDQAEYEKLNGLSGDEFDTEYLTLMVKDHHKDLREFRLEAAGTQDQTLKDAVIKAQGVIHEHLVMVNNLARSKGIALPAHRGGRPSPPPPPPTQ
jgi:putative membrane protein